MTIILVGILIVLLLWIISIYNGLIQLRTRSDNAWSDIDVQLKRRYDLIPNVVTTVEGYAKHEKSTLMSVTQARTQAMSVNQIASKGEVENNLTNSLRTLFAVAENYPDLKANKNFLELQTTLIEIEETIQAARRYYNAVVRDLNVMIQSFPSSVVANIFNFKLRDFFQLSAPDVERAVPSAKVNS